MRWHIFIGFVSFLAGCAEADTSSLDTDSEAIALEAEAESLVLEAEQDVQETIAAVENDNLDEQIEGALDAPAERKPINILRCGERAQAGFQSDNWMAGVGRCWTDAETHAILNKGAKCFGRAQPSLISDASSLSRNHRTILTQFIEENGWHRCLPGYLPGASEQMDRVLNSAFREFVFVKSNVDLEKEIRAISREHAEGALNFENRGGALHARCLVFDFTDEVVSLLDSEIGSQEEQALVAASAWNVRRCLQVMNRIRSRRRGDVEAEIEQQWPLIRADLTEVLFREIFRYRRDRSSSEKDQ